jgi:hypothetical protein
MIKCSECGYENMDGLDYCDGCGAKLEAPSQAASSPSPPPAGGSGSAPQPAEPSETNEMAQAGAPAAAEAAATPAARAAEPGASEAPPLAGEASARSEAPTGEINAGTAAPAVAAAAPTFKAKLSIIRGGRRGQEFELESGNNLIGRWDPDTGAFPEVDLDADDPEAKVSRKHALVRIDGGRISIEDIGSLNGTYVNRQPRLQPGNPLDLKDGDEIIIGKTYLKLSINPIS